MFALVCGSCCLGGVVFVALVSGFGCPGVFLFYTEVFLLPWCVVYVALVCRFGCPGVPFVRALVCVFVALVCGFVALVCGFGWLGVLFLFLP